MLPSLPLNPWRAGCVAGAFAIVVALLYIWQQTLVLRQAEVVYSNPRKQIVTKTVRVTGPVRIVTRIVERPTGERVTESIEERGAVTETTAEQRQESVVPLAEALAPPKQDRWLVGCRVLSFAPVEMKKAELLGGYSWKNRVDLLAGVRYDERVYSSLAVVLRF